MAAEQLDLTDLDAEDLKALNEVSKKGYYHNRPKTEAAPTPQLIENESRETVQQDAPSRRSEFDEFQKKWDRFEVEEEAPEASRSHSSATRIHTAAQQSAPSLLAAPPSADESVVAQLVSMGFGERESRAAAIATMNRVDAAVDYMVNATASRIGAPEQPDASSLSLLVEMGFSEKHARAALQACRNDLDRAVEHAAKLAESESTSKLQKARDALTQLESDVSLLESDISDAPKAKRLRLLEENLTQASCALDSLDVDGGVASREERRTELDRCNALDARINRLRNMVLSEDVTISSSATVEGCTASVRGSSVEESHEARVGALESSVNSTSEDRTAWRSRCPGCSRMWTPPEPPGGSCPTCSLEVVLEEGEVDAAQQRIAEAERLRTEGNTAFKAEDYAAAVQHYLAALHLDSENVAILSNLAAAELKLGEFEAAIVHATAANDLSGGFSAKALFRKGQALEGLHRFVDACEAYQSALSIEPGDKLVRQRLQSCRKANEDSLAAQA